MELKPSLLLALLMVFAQPVKSQTLLEALENSIKHDPSYRASQANRKAGEAERRIGRASLLPQISASIYEGKAETERRLLNSPNPATDIIDYDVSNNAITLQQPLFNADGRARFIQGDLISKQTIAQEAEALAQLSLRVTTAYMGILSAIDQVRLAESESKALKERLSLVNASIVAGEASRTDQAESRAQLDLANARLLEAKESLSLSLRALENITGIKSNKVLFPVELDLSQLTPPLPFEKLKSRMMLNSPSVISALYEIRIAEQEVAKQNAGHLPRVDFVVRAAQSESDTVTTIGQRNDQTTYALQMQVPIFSGFGIDASVDKATANLERANVAWQAQVQENAYKLQESYSKFNTSQIKINAFKKAVESSQESLKAAELGQTLGIRTLSDVLEAQRLLFSTQKDLSRVRYETLMSLVEVSSVSGQLNVSRIKEISDLLAVQAEVVVFERPDLINMQSPNLQQFELLEFDQDEPVTPSAEPDKVLKKEIKEGNEVVYRLEDKPDLLAPPTVEQIID
ncbi:TolC family protein [Limnobacter parvus]|uniref:TolC family protein n=1 Tax=Limnobacter parvus TaxID=2939690 RepID=A0ABT1XD79_9BURK|nr:TolC family protein [Limnobacter parvus]MCR2745237.1 TolC family protein [Limnobacter parvus]